MKRLLFGSFAAVVALSFAISAWAHHSFAAEFDTHQPITFTGRVIKVEWMNPHIYLYVDVKDELGRMTKFAIQVGSPNALARQGWNKESVKAGDVVTVFGYKARDGWNRLNGQDITMSNGHKVFVGSPEYATHN